MNVIYQVGDNVIMKKPHPCGTNLWEITKLGVDIKIKCIKCQHSIIISREKFNQRLKKVVNKTDEE